MNAQTDAITSFVPLLVARRVAQNGPGAMEPGLECFDAAVMVVDITGFTALTEDLADRSQEGLDEITALLNHTFGWIIDAVADQGGEVVKFGGDSLLALWPFAREDGPSMTLQGAACALQLQASAGSVGSPGREPVRLRIGLAVGMVGAFHVGGVRDRWECVVAGRPIAEVSHAQELARPGEVVATGEAMALLESEWDGNVVEDGGTATFIRIERLLRPVHPGGVARPFIDPPDPEGLVAYVPGAIRSRVRAGQVDWLAEVRTVSVMFIRLPDADPAAGGALGEIQSAVERVQACLYRHEGSLNKLSFDDKGTTVLAVFGLPPLAHENDSMRAVEAAFAIQDALGTAGVFPAIGIATGRAFCGPIGNDLRREYTVTGDVVNIAARITQTARPGQTLCDAATERAVGGRFTFEALPAMSLKGKREPVTLFEPRQGQAPTIIRSAIVGRDSERQALELALTELESGQCHSVLIEGEPGIGKSRLLTHLVEVADERAHRVVRGGADAAQLGTPYFAWRGVFRTLLYATRGPRSLTDQIERVLGETELAPLAGEACGVDIPDTPVTATMAGDARATNTRKVLLAVLRDAAERALESGGLVVALEDGHWFDSASWALAIDVVASGTPCLLAITTRPALEAASEQLTEFRASRGVQLLQVGPLDAPAISILAARRLGVRSLPAEVANLIGERAEGNPFFSEELALALRDAGLVRVQDGQAWAGPSSGEAAFKQLPATLQGVITSRIDRLSSGEQLTLKVASVIGRSFSQAMLRDIHPLAEARRDIGHELDTFDGLELTRTEATEPERTCVFKHVITQEVCYGLLAAQQRRSLHRRVAEWIEHTNERDLSPVLGLLAYHWNRADEPERAIDYFEAAGEHALRAGADYEAVQHFEDAIRTDRDGAAAQTRRALWHLRLGEAYYGYGTDVSARRAMETGLRLLGDPVPQTARGLRVAAARAAATQLWRLATHRKPHSPRDVARSETLLHRARAYERLGLVAFIAVDINLYAYACLRLVNVAEEAGPSVTLARAYSGACVSSGGIPALGLARAYGRRARAALAEAGGDPEAELWMHQCIGVMECGPCRWEVVEAELGAAIELADRLGRNKIHEESQFCLGYTALARGQSGRAVTLFEEVEKALLARREPTLGLTGIASRARCLVAAGKPAEALPLLRDGVSLIPAAGLLNPGGAPDAGTVTEDDLFMERFLTSAFLAKTEFECGNIEEAERALRWALEVIAGQKRSFVFYFAQAYADVAEISLRLWARSLEGQGGDPGEMRELAQQALDKLARHARTFAIARPARDRWQGVQLWLEGKHRRARRAWRHSLYEARRLELPLEEELTNAEIRSLDSTLPA